MRVDDRFRRNIRAFYAWVASVVVLGAGPLIASRLIHTESIAGRVGGVVVGVGTLVPWMWVVTSAIRRGDEFTRGMYLIASSISFAGMLLLIAAIEWLARAGFIRRPELMFVWLFALALWLCAFVGVKRYFERAQ